MAHSEGRPARGVEAQVTEWDDLSEVTGMGAWRALTTFEIVGSTGISPPPESGPYESLYAMKV